MWLSVLGIEKGINWLSDFGMYCWHNQQQLWCIMFVIFKTINRLLKAFTLFPSLQNDGTSAFSDVSWPNSKPACTHLPLTLHVHTKVCNNKDCAKTGRVDCKRSVKPLPNPQRPKLHHAKAYDVPSRTCTCARWTKGQIDRSIWDQTRNFSSQSQSNSQICMETNEEFVFLKILEYTFLETLFWI